MSAAKMISRIAAVALAWAAATSSAFADPQPAETPPEVKFVTGTYVSPQAALNAYGGGTDHGSSFTNPSVGGFTEPYPEISETAKGLKNDPDLIFEYVRNHVDTEFAFGLRKGALGALIDKSGTPFDQNVLFVEMVRAAGLGRRGAGYSPRRGSPAHPP